MITPEDLFEPLSYDAAKTTVYDALAATGVTTTGWKPGFVVRTIIAALAVVMVVFSELICLIAKSAYLDYATGVWLTFLARYVYGTEREVATFASGEVTLDNSAGGGLYELQPGDLVLLNPDTKKTYRNVSLIELNPGEVLTGVAIVAIEAGSASTSSAGTIVGFETPLPDCTVTNPLAVVGFDEEDDPTLRVRCREVLGSRSAMGPDEAYASAARRAKLTDGTAIGAERIRLRRDGKGNVYVYVAKAAAAITGSIGDVESELGRVNVEIQRTAAPLGVTARVIAASPVLVAMGGTMYLTDRQGFTDAAINTKAETALTAYLRTVPIGGFTIDGANGKVYLDDLKAVCRVLTSIFRVVPTATADVSLAINEFPVLAFTPLTVSFQKQIAL